MKNKLTLRLESSLIRRAKKHAKKKKTSVSQLVADYFTVMEEENTATEELPPITASLSGILKNAEISKDDYKKHLEEKYLQ